MPFAKMWVNADQLCNDTNQACLFFKFLPEKPYPLPFERSVQTLSISRVKSPTHSTLSNVSGNPVILYSRGHDNHMERTAVQYNPAVPFEVSKTATREFLYIAPTPPKAQSKESRHRTWR